MASSSVSLAAHSPWRSRAGQSNTLSSPSNVISSRYPRDRWRYGDYPDGVGLCQFGCAITWALARRAVEHILIPSKCHLIPLPRDWWRYGDYPDGVGLCQYGSAITLALTRRAVEHILIPSMSFDPAAAGLVEVWGFEPQTFSLRTRRSTN